MSDVDVRRFRCPCGAENKFNVPYGDEREVKVRCGKCKTVCRMRVPANSKEKATKKFLEKIGLGGNWFSGGNF